MFVRLPILSLALLLGATAAVAQTVRWEAAEGGMANSVILVFENCEPDGTPELPAIPGLTFTSQGRSESSQSTFGPGGFTTIRTVGLTYTIRGRTGGPVQIPAFVVKTNKGPMRVPAFNAAAPAAPLETVASSKLVPERTSVWAGEIFGLNYELSASRRTNPQISPTFDWNSTPLVAEDWSKPEVTEPAVNGERRVHVTFRARAVAKEPGRIKLEAASHLLSIQTGTIGFGIISQPRMEQVSVTSDQPAIEVRPLPSGAPAGFSGAVGQFKLQSKVIPQKAAVGEPVTWTLELTGTGNWPDVAGLPSREVSNDFQVVQPKAKRTPVEGKLFDVTLVEDVVLVPTKAGTYALGPVKFVYFDPKSGTYKTETAPGTTVTISPPQAPQFNISTQPPVESENQIPEVGSAQSAAEPRKPVTSPPPPAGIPRDPLPGSATAPVPLTRRTLVIGLLSPVAGVLLLWLGLAIRRARETDPVRPRREARDRLAKTLAHLQSNSDAERVNLLHAWQRDAAVLWQLSHAAPSSSAFLAESGPAHASSHPRGAGTLPNGAEWAALWREADRALYGAKTALPSDWIARAQAALVSARLPGFRPLRLFLPQNLMPFAAVIAFLLLAIPSLVQAASLDAAAAYRKGDFEAAEKGWRGRVAAQPTDWIARHNLSLALAQREQPGESAAQAAAAYVQQPADPAVRWHFALATERSGAGPAQLARFISPGLLQTMGRLASPSVWQRLLVAGTWGISLAIGVLLYNTYQRRRPALRWIAIGLLLAGGALAGTATAGIIAFGSAGNREAVIVARSTTLLSIPTEADTTQKTSPLAAGSLALVDRTFLGWTRLSFENGQTGWVRKEDVVPLWR